MTEKESIICRLIEISLEEAKSKHGTHFNSDHEAYAVIKEEIEECSDELLWLEKHIKEAWGSIKNVDFGNILKDNMQNIRYDAQQLITEAAQVAAVCDKYLGGK